MKKKNRIFHQKIDYKKGVIMEKFKSFWNKMYFKFHPNHKDLKVKYLKVWGLGWIGYHHK